MSALGCRTSVDGLKEVSPGGAGVAADPRRPGEDARPAGNTGGGTGPNRPSPAPVPLPPPSSDAASVPPGEPLSDAAAPGAAAPDTAPVPDTRPREQSQALAEALVLFLPLDEGQAPPYDQSGLRQAVMMRNPGAGHWTDGRYGHGVQLDGGPQGCYLRVESAETFNVVSLTVAAWVKRPDVPADAPEGDGVILSRRASGSGGSVYSLRITQGRLGALINSTNGYRADVTTRTLIPTGVWVHLAMTFDLYRVRLYVDGGLAASAPYQLPPAPDVTPLIIGGVETDTVPPTVVGRLAATVDEVLVYNRALPAEDIAALARGVVAQIAR